MMETISITRDTVNDMANVSIRDLRNEGGEVVDRAVRGERIIITRSGTPVAELNALRPPLSAEAVLERARRLGPVDAVALREDIDQLFPETLDEMLGLD
jgi:antitoxin (DNA-binding transcriptional repressor) of toxin-antitoxin stability system